MPVDISTLDIATPLPTSASNPLALELNGNLALAQCPSVISRLADGSIQLCAPTRGAASKSTHRTRCEWKESRYWALSSAAESAPVAMVSKPALPRTPWTRPGMARYSTFMAGSTTRSISPPALRRRMAQPASSASCRSATPSTWLGGLPCGSHAVRVLLAPCQEGTCSSLRSRGIRVR